MAQCRRVIVAESLGPSFRKRSRIPILFGLGFIHGKFKLGNSSYVKNTPLAVLFSTGPRERLLGSLGSVGLKPAGVDGAITHWPRTGDRNIDQPWCALLPIGDGRDIGDADDSPKEVDRGQAQMPSEHTEDESTCPGNVVS
jgi:hypothetical protein